MCKAVITEYVEVDEKPHIVMYNKKKSFVLAVESLNKIESESFKKTYQTN